MASRVVVIDKDLLKEDPNTSFQVIIKVLTSAWMQRLWTLQEAYLSRRLFIAFRGPEDPAGTGLSLTQSEQIGVTLEDVDKRVRDLDRLQKDAFTTSMAELIKRKFFHNLMGEDRQIRNRNDHPIETRGSMVIASAWRSSRWRNTSRPEDETLALSTLLNLDYRTTTIENASAKEPAVIDKAIDENNVWPRKNGDANQKTKRANMMKDFWTLIHRNYEGSIPAGLIFLPGDKMSLPGFGWAPNTWMSARDESYPYPLSMCGDPHVILGSNWGKQGLTFPIDQYISEWYKVTSIGRGQAEDRAARKVLPRIFANTSPEFGIILCRPKPREWPPEIGLLVEIYREAWKRKEPERVNRKYYYCQVIRRVWVSRIRTPVLPKDYKLPSGRTGNPPIGELMPENTLWYVDGYLEHRNRGNLGQRPPPLVSDARDSAIDMGHVMPIHEDKPQTQFF
ncbi:hypothetical protein UCRPA7_8897 [Phaeoacremonium minimum UCRPA7]|uniref:Heterokaryon incompatibility domain-containing protein n=1 Tax=Phaeoacremonium minimum (strain UCR-PA7) TaxID=1286976 RepID=R8B8P4_PHAM7|nr:hypothetical protein UCRPA7_8897 [Phaeoacremonium minimum UCRPA7]EON95679.1 hypothetical protein UCRPA7_8897 [Phaeoacremonium minimum UCRPA7]